MEQLQSFQVYSRGKEGEINILVDRIWVGKKRIYFHIIEEISNDKNSLRKEKERGVYSIDQNDLFSIRCRLYF